MNGEERRAAPTTLTCKCRRGRKSIFAEVDAGGCLLKKVDVLVGDHAALIARPTVVAARLEDVYFFKTIPGTQGGRR